MTINRYGITELPCGNLRITVKGWTSPRRWRERQRRRVAIGSGDDARKSPLFNGERAAPLQIKYCLYPLRLSRLGAIYAPMFRCLGATK